MQNGQPVSYSSRALTVSEKKYSQIEKELLARVFGVERNHQLVYGRKIVLWSDHKPLETISKKPLATAPKRLQRLLLRLQQYDFEIRYKPGPEMYLSDTLSRAYLKVLFTLGSGILNGAISVDGCVQVSIDAFIDEMNREKILAQNEN